MTKEVNHDKPERRTFAWPASPQPASRRPGNRLHAALLRGTLPRHLLWRPALFPRSWRAAISAFFQARPSAVTLCAFLQFGSAIPLGIFTATIVSRLEFFGVRAAGIKIALFGGFATCFMMMSNAAILWSMAHPGIAQDGPLTLALYFIAFAMGGPGYSVSLGLLMAGISVPLLFRRDVSRWIPILGLVLAACGELSWFSFELSKAIPLIPLTRFPGFIWMIAVGFALPSSLPQPARQEARS